MRMPITAEGAIPKGGGKFTPRLAILRYGWRVVPQNSTHSLYISGEQITDDGQSGPACMNTAALDAGVSVTIHYEPATAEMLSGTGGSTGPTAAEIAAAILAAAQITPIHSDMRKAVGQAYHGDGSEGNKLRSTLVP
jgi:hypothetical protein